MAIFAVSITKSVGFRGVQQEFSNVYHFSGTTPSAANALLLAQNIRNQEQDFHSSDVTFLRFKAWTAGGTPGANQMIAQGSLTGIGLQGTNSSMDRERAVLIRFANGIDTRGRPVYLRKWFHSCGSCQGVTFAGAGILQNTAQIASGDRTTIQTAAAGFLSIGTPGGPYQLCSPSGTAGGTPIVCHPYLEHHQLGEMWR